MSPIPELSQYRLSIDLFDRALLDLLAERARMARGCSVCVSDRGMIWHGMGHNREAMARGLSAPFLEQFGGLLDQMGSWQVPSPLTGLVLDDLLGSLEVLDRTILMILSERFKVVRRIGALKRANDMAPLDPRRWHSLLSERLDKGEVLGLDRDWTRQLFEAIHDYALHLES
ncbi:MAG: chorismate mutase [bacterium]|nr:chorismate mutase [bacterium]